MGQTKTNNFSLLYAKESAVPGVLPVSPLWKQLEPNSIPAFGSTTTLVTPFERMTWVVSLTEELPCTETIERVIKAPTVERG